MRLALPHACKSRLRKCMCHIAAWRDWVSAPESIVLPWRKSLYKILDKIHVPNVTENNISYVWRQKCARVFCVKLGKSSKETLEMLQQANGLEVISRPAGFRWCRGSKGKKMVVHNAWSGRPSTASQVSMSRKQIKWWCRTQDLPLWEQTGSLSVSLEWVYHTGSMKLGMYWVCTSGFHVTSTTQMHV
jgi:hypothetical protein